MMQILMPIVIDLINPDPLPVVNAKQGDTARGIRVTITKDGQICQLTSEEVNIFIRKSDGKLIYNRCTLQGGDIVAMFTNQALAVPGKSQVELEILSGKEKISTPIALIDVLPTNIGAEAIESTNEFERYETIISDVTAAEAKRESAEGARNTAEEARKEAETLRVQAETDRKEDESERISAETERSEAEALRAQAESLREQAEAARVAAEELREAAKTAMQQATEAANAAAEAAGAYVLGDISGKTVSFTEAEARENIASGESTSTLFGKIRKWFADLKDAAFASIANNLTTKTAGSVLDARQGAVLGDAITELNGKFAANGSATSATKLDTATAGSATQPVYFTGGKPVACTHTLGKSVPADAVFVDTWRPVENVFTSTSLVNSLTANGGRVLALEKAEMRKTAWGKSLIIGGSKTRNLPHGIVMFANHTVYGIWVAGNEGAFELNKVLLHGDDYASFSCNRNSGAVTASWPSNIGIVYIGA